MKLAQGSWDEIQAYSEQPFYIDSVGKLFTSVLVGILYKNGKLKLPL